MMYSLENKKLFFSTDIWLSPYVTIVPDYQTYKTKLIIVKPSTCPYQDEDLSIEVLI